MKKLLSLAAVMAMVLSLLAGCNGTVTPSTSQVPQTSTEAPATTPAEDDLTSAKDYVFAMYNSKAVATPSDYQVTSVVAIAGVKFDVDWSVEITAGPKDSVKVGTPANNQVTIDVDEKTPEAVSYNLIATVKDASGKTASVSFPHTIPAYKEFTFDEYVAAKENDTVVVKGVITGTMSKTRGNSANCLYLQDNDGGYYVYQMADDPDATGLKPGVEVRVTGTRSTYSGTYEITNATVEVLNAGPVAFEALDVTELYEKAESLKDADLTKRQAKLVTVKGVEVTGQDTASGYYKFKLGNLESYVRISGSVCPLTKDDQAALVAAHSEHLGWIANVTGVLCVYDGAFYLTPITADAFEYIGLPEKTDAEKAAYEADLIELAAKITEDTVLTVNLQGATYDTVKLEWSADNDCVAVDGDKLVITCPEEDTVVTVKAVLTCGAETLEKEIQILVEAAATDLFVAEIVDEPTAGEAYKLVLFQNAIGKTLYFNGEASGDRYLGTTEKADKAVDVFLEEAEGGFKLYFMNGEEKTYIEIGENADGKTAAQLKTETEVVGTWNAEAKTLFTKVGEKEYYLGTYKTYDTFSVSATTYITGDNAAKVDDSQFPARLCTVSPAAYKNTVVEEPEADKAYKLVLFQNAIGKTLYFNGEASGDRYLGTTEKADKAADVYLEAVEGGFKLYFMNGEEKTYIEIGENADGKTAAQLKTETEVVGTWNAEAKTLFTKVGEKEYYLGTYKTYDTFSVSATTYITGENAAKVDDSQFPARLVEVELVPLFIGLVIEPEEEIPYKLVLEQNAVGKTFYFDGEASGERYLSSTEKLSKAVDVYAEKVEGGWKLYFFRGEEKLYIQIGENAEGKTAAMIVSETDLVAEFMEDVYTFKTKVGEKEYYLGTYKEYTTFSVSSISYITGDKADTVDVTQFPARLFSVMEESD